MKVNYINFEHISNNLTGRTANNNKYGMSTKNKCYLAKAWICAFYSPRLTWWLSRDIETEQQQIS